MFEIIDPSDEVRRAVELAQMTIVNRVNEQLHRHGLQYVDGYVIESQWSEQCKDNALVGMDFEKQDGDEDYRVVGGAIRFGENEELDRRAMVKSLMHGAYLLNCEGCE